MKQLIWPDPLVVPPSNQHTHSIILLHGRGSNAARFGPELLGAPTAALGVPLGAHFPGVKFIFPTAKKRRAVAFNRTPINQWFDVYALTEPTVRGDLPYDGLRETSAFVHGLIAAEAQLVGVDHVVIGGLSQGCAAALHVLLNFHGPSPLLGLIGMSGWLPFAEILRDETEGEDVFDAEDPQTNAQLNAANTARDIASLPPLALPKDQVPCFVHTPIFLGHGVYDQKVPMRLGAQAHDVMRALGCDVEWREYNEGHWYKVPDEIDDLVVWLKKRINPQITSLD